MSRNPDVFERFLATLAPETLDGVYFGPLSRMLQGIYPQTYATTSSKTLLRRAAQMLLKGRKRPLRDGDKPVIRCWSNPCEGRADYWLVYAEAGTLSFKDISAISLACPDDILFDIYFCLYMISIVRNYSHVLTIRLHDHIRQLVEQTNFDDLPERYRDSESTQSLPPQIQYFPRHILRELRRLEALSFPLSTTYKRLFSFQNTLASYPVNTEMAHHVEKLANFVQDQNAPKVLTIWGGPASGKTQIVSTFLSSELARGKCHPHFFIEACEDRNRPTRILEHLTIEVQLLFRKWDLMEVPDSDGRALSLLTQALDGIKKSCGVCMFFDGIEIADQHTYSDRPLSVLLEELIRVTPRSTRIVVTSREKHLLKRLGDDIHIELTEPGVQSQLKYAFDGRNADKFLQSVKEISNPDERRRCLEEAHSKYPDDVPISVELFAEIRSNADPPVALRHHIESLCPVGACDWESKGLYFALEHRMQDAIGALKRSLEIDSTRHTANRLLAQAFDTCDKNLDAQNFARKALSFATTEWEIAESYYLLCQTLAKGDLIDKASEVLELARKVGAHHRSLRSSEGWCLIRLGKIDEAHSMFKELLESAETRLDEQVALRGLSSTAYSKNSLIECITYLHRLLELEPKLAQYRTNLAWAYRLIGRHDAATEEALRAISDDPTSPPAYNALGAAYIERGQRYYGRAVNAFHKIIEIEPTGRYAGTAWMNIAYVYDREGKLEEARDSLLKAKALSPRNAQIDINYGHLLIRLGRLQDAATEFWTAVRLEMDDESMIAGWRGLATCATAEGRYADANQFLTKIEELRKRRTTGDVEILRPERV